MIPGIRETIRVKGKARLTADDVLLDTIIVEDARSEGAIDAEYMHSGSATMRSGLWDAERQATRDEEPCAGELIGASSKGIDAASYDAMLDESKRNGLW